MILSPFGRLASFFELFKVLRSLSALWDLGFAALCKAQLSNPLRILSKTQPRLDDEYTCGRLNRLTAHYFGYWLLAIGYGLEYAACRYPCLSPLTFRLITSSPLTSNLILCQRQCFDADAAGRCKSATK